MGFTVCADIGSTGLRAYVPDTGARIVSSSAAAVYRGEDKAFAVGDDAYELTDKAGSRVEVRYPMRGGMIADRKILTEVLAGLMDDAGASKRLRRTSLMIAVNDAGVCPDMAACAYAAGFDEITAVPCDAVGAFGAGMDPTGTTGAFVIEVGAEHMSAAVYALGRTVRRILLPFGMSEVDEAVMRRVREEKGCIIGIQTAREIKHLFLNASRVGGITQAFAGIDAKRELPAEFTLDSRLIENAADPYIRSLVTMLREFMTGLPEGICADISDKGAVLTGGGSAMYGLAELLSDRLGIDVKRADDADACMTNAFALLSEDAERLSRINIFTGSKE